MTPDVKIHGTMSGSASTAPLSVSTGDYIKAIWRISGEGAASTKDISVHLSVAPASVTNMLGRLQEMGFVKYERYHGASLTERGRQEALRLVRRHRLIETFLLKHLGYTWQEVHEEADRLEHAVSDEFTERLAELLGHPDQDPHGDPIPTSEGILEPDDSMQLSEVREGESVRVFKVSDGSNRVLDYLGERGLVPGRTLIVEERREIDGMVVVSDEDGATHYLGGPLVRSVFVRKSG
ncbi:MAG: metal-dependent transcriptional regulator [Rubrobacter sp.]